MISSRQRCLEVPKEKEVPSPVAISLSDRISGRQRCLEMLREREMPRAAVNKLSDRISGRHKYLEGQEKEKCLEQLPIACLTGFPVVGGA